MRARLEPAPTWALQTSSTVMRDAIARQINAHADRLGTGRLARTDRIIATGHQAWLWHPGILAKDMAMVAAWKATGEISGGTSGGPLHLVVDQDAHEALSVTLPVVEGERLSTRVVRLASHDPAVPTGWQPAVAPEELIDGIERIGPLSLRERVRVRGAETDARAEGGHFNDTANPVPPHPSPLPEGEGAKPSGSSSRTPQTSACERLLDAFHDLPECRTLAEQIAVVLTRLMRPYCGNLPVVFASDLAEIFDYDELLRDARACAEAYNRAVRSLPGAGIAPLVVERERVEFPVWACRWNRPRKRVFADLADSRPLWTFDDGEPIDRDAYDLAPKALLLTAIVRSRACDLFIHGSGGAGTNGYDRITEQWWSDWRGESLAPMTLATADVTLDFDAPVADRADVARAVWYRHHLPHNIDRALPGPPDPRKVALFNVKDKAAFDGLRRINAELVAAHPELIREADERLRRARIGVENAAVAAKRDWCFALYRPEKLEALRDRIAKAFV